MRDQRMLFDLTQDGLIIGEKIQRIYPEFDVSGFVSDVRTEMEGQTIYNVTKAIGWHRFELEVNGDVLGGFDFEVTAPKDRRNV